MRKMNLDDTWKYCLQMWKWIATQIKKNPDLDVRLLKTRWVKNHGFYGIDKACFFCEYVNKRYANCDLCPGRKIDENFECTCHNYSYVHKPIAFYKKLFQLNTIRKAKQ